MQQVIALPNSVVSCCRWLDRSRSDHCAQASLLAADETPTGLVRVTCSGIDRLPPDAIAVDRNLSRRHPGLRVELIMSDHFLDIAKGEADVAIRAGIPDEEIPLGARSPTYLGRYIAAALISIATAGWSGPRTSTGMRLLNSMAILETTMRPDGFAR